MLPDQHRRYLILKTDRIRQKAYKHAMAPAGACMRTSIVRGKGMPEAHTCAQPAGPRWAWQSKFVRLLGVGVPFVLRKLKLPWVTILQSDFRLAMNLLNSHMCAQPLSSRNSDRASHVSQHLYCSSLLCLQKNLLCLQAMECLAPAMSAGPRT